ncbi:TPA: DNA methyltransferase [Candidatus Shapirobacteria bacterium]|nr:DNA methyltransferase [Candidatus Shapirobacteria bacterium]
MTKDELLNTVDRLADKFFANGIVAPTAYIEQISFLFFAKMLEEQENDRFKAASVAGKSYKSIFDDENEKFRWSNWSQKTDTEEMFKFVRDDLITFFQTGIQNHEDVKKFFREVRFLIPDAILLTEVVDIIGKIDFNKIDTDVKGDMYEHLTARLATAGRIGSFRTPRHIIRTIVKMVDPKLGQKICDPACGTAGFILAAYEHIKSQNSKTTLEEITSDNGDKYQKGKGDLLGEKDWDILQENTFWGFDVSPDSIKIAIMNMLLHGLAAKNVYRRDSLAGGADPEEEMSWDIVLANPPFAGEVSLERLRSVLPIKAKDSSILFVGLMIESLKQGGTCGVIVNEGLLFGRNKSAVALRKLLLDKMELQAVVSLPQGVFNPYAGVKTSFLIFKNTGKPTQKVWFYEVENDGYTKGTNRKPDPSKNDLPDLLSKWTERKVSEKSWVIDVEKIKENDFILSSSTYKPESDGDKQNLREPKKILEEIESLEKEINVAVAQIKKNI